MPLLSFFQVWSWRSRGLAPAPKNNHKVIVNVSTTVLAVQVVLARCHRWSRVLLVRWQNEALRGTSRKKVISAWKVLGVIMVSWGSQASMIHFTLILQMELLCKLAKIVGNSHHRQLWQHERTRAQRCYFVLKRERINKKILSLFNF